MRFITINPNTFVVVAVDPEFGSETVIGLYSLDDARQDYIRGMPEGTKKK